MSNKDKIWGRATRTSEADQGHTWLSVSDLMAGLMMVFLFIAIALMRYGLSERDRVRDIALTYQASQGALYAALQQEFAADLPRWMAHLDQETLSITFNAPEVLFALGSTELSSEFQLILDDFFPRYLDILLDFSESIDEVRVEGHTSSDWGQGFRTEEAYFNNMRLSQGRTRSVLEYVYHQESHSPEQQDWIKQQVAAVGFSSSRLILDQQGEEDAQRSRRVSFRVITNAEQQIRQILAAD
ncbi:MAG: OmpA family protein [Marinospirillum sp.]|uniref:OmpA/MotB family protein n=1 Tax=Marinospirillum sp. TaxID=2183934 RepID=UPI001A05A3E0|nr:OmpA family protein [Marinospirillum sp.]MBE0508489.1 OmpA family protein [Marinospirillum sp.]